MAQFAIAKKRESLVGRTSNLVVIPTVKQDPSPWVAGTFSLAIVILVVFYLRDAVVDDAFVYLQVARQLLINGEWAFNATETMNPCTGPLYVLLLVGIALLGIFGESCLLVAFGAGLWCSMLASERLLRTQPPWIRWAGLMLPLTIGALLQSVGLESVWFLNAVLWAAILSHSDREWLLGAVVAVAVLLRPEGLLLVPIILGVRFCCGLPFSWRGFVVIAAILGAWTTFSLYQFGEVLPHTVQIKHLQGTVGWWAQQGGYLGYFASRSAFPIATFGLSILGLIALWRCRGAYDRGVWVVILFAIAQVLGFAALRAPYGYFWYNIPGDFALGLTALIGLSWLLHTRRRVLERRARLQAVLRITSVLALFVVSADPVWQVSRTFRIGAEYRTVGAWLAANTDPEVSVAVTEIGYLGFYSQRRIVDMHGLLHKAALQRLSDSAPDWWFTLYTPDIIVAHRPPWPNEPTPINWPPESLARFSSEYERIYTIAAPSPMSEALEVYRRISLQTEQQRE